MATLTASISALAAAVRNKLNAMTPRLLPTGGGAGQALVKSADADFSVQWAAIASGGSSGTAPKPATLRGFSTYLADNSASVTVPLPAGCAVDDWAIISAAHAYAIQTPTGFARLLDDPGSNINGALFDKQLSASDITTGSIQVAFDGAYYGTVGVAIFDGSTVTNVRGAKSNRSVTNRTSYAASFGSVGPHETLFTFAAIRSNTDTVSSITPSSVGKSVSSQDAAARTALYTPGASETVTSTVSFTANVAYSYIANLIIVGVAGSGSGSTAAPPAWGAITGTLSDQTDLQGALDAKAPLTSPALAGTPTAPTAAANASTTQIATTAFATTALNTALALRIRGVNFFQAGKPTGGQLISKAFSGSAFTIKATNCKVTSETAATASTVLVIKKNGTNIGTATFAAGSTNATVAITTTAVAANDAIALYGAATADATLADITALIRE